MTSAILGHNEVKESRFTSKLLTKTQDKIYEPVVGNRQQRTGS
jgi:hypothetical protein